MVSRFFFYSCIAEIPEVYYSDLHAFSKILHARRSCHDTKADISLFPDHGLLLGEFRGSPELRERVSSRPRPAQYVDRSPDLRRLAARGGGAAASRLVRGSPGKPFREKAPADRMPVLPSPCGRNHFFGRCLFPAAHRDLHARDHGHAEHDDPDKCSRHGIRARRASGKFRHCPGDRLAGLRAGFARHRERGRPPGK